MALRFQIQRLPRAVPEQYRSLKLIAWTFSTTHVLVVAIGFAGLSGFAVPGALALPGRLSDAPDAARPLSGRGESGAG